MTSRQPRRASVAFGISSSRPMIFQAFLKMAPASIPPSTLASMLTGLYSGLIIAFSAI